MIRNIANRVTGTAISTGRFAVGIPLGVARNILDRVPFPGGAGNSGGTVDAPTSTSVAADAVSTDVPRRPVREQSIAETRPIDAPPAESPRKQGKAGTPKAGDPGHVHGEGPDVVLAVDTPPMEIEPPVDVVGETLAAEARQVDPPAEIDDEPSVVYSTSSDDR